MRLWSKDLIDVLPDMQLRGQWRECCLIAKALHDGNLNHLLVNKVKEYPDCEFVRYAHAVCSEMQKRKYSCDFTKFMMYFKTEELNNACMISWSSLFDGWHNDRYLRQCLYNLQEKHDCGGIPDSEWERIAKKYPWIEEG